MKIKHKTYIIAMISVIILSLLTFLIFKFSYYGYINKDYEDHLEKGFKTIDYILENEQDNIRRTLIDWASWDDTYNFISDLNKNYIDSNLSAGTLETLNLQMMIFFDDDGNLVFSKENESHDSINQSLKQEILFEDKIAIKQNNYNDIGLILVGERTFFVEEAPVTKSNDQYIVNGSLMIIREIDEKFLSYVKNVTNVDLEFKNLSSINDEYNENLKTDDIIKIRTNDKQNIEGYKILKNKYVDKNIVLFVGIDKEHDINARPYFTVFTVGFLFLLIGILRIDQIIIDNQIFRRLSKLTNFMYKVSVTKDTTLRLSIPGDDEFTRVAESTNEMLASIDDAYKDIREMGIRFRTIMEATNDGYIDFYLQTKELHISPKWKEFIGYKGENGYELFEDYISKIHPEYIESQRNTYYDLISGKIDHCFSEYRVITENGDIIWVMERGKVSERDEEGQPIRVVSTLSDITTRKKYEEEILFLSYSDKLTGLRNRPFMEQRFHELDLNEDSIYFIIMGDVNGLKLSNDSLSHRAGDKLLRVIAEIIQSCCDSDDIVSRWGGDEFVVLIKEKDRSYVYNLMNNIKVACKNRSEANLKISIALGYAEKDNEHIKADHVMNLAERRMYRNKLIESDSARSSTISSLIRTLHEKHSETEEHTIRIKNLSLKLGKRLGLAQEILDELELVASLHDIGKIGIPEQILMKPSKLNDEEWVIMKKHTNIGYRIVKATPQLEHIADEILYHHEKYDGTGYPDGLKGEEIPLVSRIINICDSFDVMTNRRAYKEAMNREYAINELKRCSGTQFDPFIVKEFLKLLEEEEDKI